jgi:hypothetical protein
MIRRAAVCADLGVKELLGASSYGAPVASGFARTGAVMKKIMEEVSDWEILTTKVLMGTWAAPPKRSAPFHPRSGKGSPRRGPARCLGPHSGQWLRGGE